MVYGVLRLLLRSATVYDDRDQNWVVEQREIADGCPMPILWKARVGDVANFLK